MTSSRSIGSTSKRALALCAALIALLAFARTADARKRVAVLDFSGPKADTFQSQIEGVIKKGNSLVSAQKWADAADELGATKMSAKNIAKVAAKLNVDGVVVGTIDRRGSRYFVHVKLRAGATGEQVAEVQLVVRGGKLTSSDLGEVREQIVGAIEKLEAPGDSGDDDEASADDGDDEPRAKGKGKGHDKAKDKGKAKGKHKLTDDDATASDDKGDKGGDDEADDEPRAKDKDKGKDKHRGFRGHDRGEDDVAAADDEGDDEPKGKTKDKDKGKAKSKAKDKGKAKHVADDDAAAEDETKGEAKDEAKDEDGGERVASRDRDDEAASDDDEVIGAAGTIARDPNHRPFDALAGLSFTGRNLSFTTSPGLTNKPQGYKSTIPVTGLFVDADLYPLAFNGKNKSITRDLGLTVMFDRVLSISSQLNYKDMAGATQTATLGTTEQHLAAGVIFRHALGKQPTDPTLFFSVRYNRSKFVIDKSQAPMGVTVDIPNTDYTYIDPGAAIRYPLSPKIALAGGVRVLVITNTGEMQSPDQYGAATVLGFDVDAGGDYMLDKQWFVHAGLKLSTIGFSFKGAGTLSNNRDGDPTTTDVSAARDTYYGAVVTAGYLY